MKAELQNELYEKYPALFVDRTKSPQETCMAWGIECGDGWYGILSSLCFQIAQHEKTVLEDLEREGKTTENFYPVRFTQIKEKFGGLRVYFAGGDEFIEGLAAMAEDVSYKICEICGCSGRPNNNGWISTLCDGCRQNPKPV